MKSRTTLVGAVCVVLILVGSACSGSATNSSSGKIRVVAAEGFWGSFATELGGDRVDVANIVDSPDIDPHDYEPTPGDGRAVARARLAIVNGAGYDEWATKLLDSSPADDRKVIDVGHLVGVKAGSNPHLWYSPTYVYRVIDEISGQYETLDPANKAYFEQRKHDLLISGLSQYGALLSDISTKFAGTPVGASESIVTPLAQSLKLDMKTPESFLDTVSEGNDPTAADKATVDRQIQRKEIKVFVYNSQNATPDVQRLVDEAKAENIPVVTVTETPTPRGVSFEQWQVAQLTKLRDGLQVASGK